MNKYYLTLVFKPDLDEKARQELVNSMVKRLGKVIKQEDWGMRDLSYPIQHQTKGFYVHFEFESEPSTIKALDKAVKIEEDILRYLIVRS